VVFFFSFLLKEPVQGLHNRPGPGITKETTERSYRAFPRMVITLSSRHTKLKEQTQLKKETLGKAGGKK
jgi:hypothetical protein